MSESDEDDILPASLSWKEHAPANDDSFSRMAAAPMATVLGESASDAPAAGEDAQPLAEASEALMSAEQMGLPFACAPSGRGSPGRRASPPSSPSGRPAGELLAEQVSMVRCAMPGQQAAADEQVRLQAEFRRQYGGRDLRRGADLEPMWRLDGASSP
jgi:hypothetical protein